MVRVLLDTCAVLLTAQAPNRLSLPARKLLVDVNTIVFTSVVTAGEVACLADRKHIVLPRHWKTWFRDAVEQGEEVIVCRRNIPFARITAMPVRRNRTTLGFDRGKVRIRGDITGPAVPERTWNALRDDHDPLK